MNKKTIKIHTKIATISSNKINSSLFSYIEYCQIWLNVLTDHCPSNNITKLKYIYTKLPFTIFEILKKKSLIEQLSWFLKLYSMNEN
jgi:hypothetical protein